MSSRKVVPDVKMKTAQSRKRNSRRNPRKSSINTSELLAENGDGRNKKGKRLKGDEPEGGNQDEESQDGMFLQAERDLYEGMLQLFPPIELDCCPAEQPVAPGTPVTLHGIILHETSAGLIVLNVRWRRRIFSGALIDIEKNRCSAEQMRPDPTSVCDGTTKFIPVKALNFSAAGEVAVKPPESLLGNASAHAKLNGKFAKASGKCGKSLIAPLEPLAPLKCEENAKRSGKALEQPYIECHEPNCGKRYKHINGLKYHRRTVHPPKADDGFGKENKNETPEEENLSNAEAEVEEKADSELSDDVKNKEVEETAKRPCKKRQSNDEESNWDQDGSSENTEKEELTENERRIEKLRIEARKASATLQHIINLEQCFEKRPDEASDPELGMDRRDHVVDQQAVSSRLRVHEALAVKDDREGVVTVSIKQEVCDQEDVVTTPIRQEVGEHGGVITVAIKQEVCEQEDVVAIAIKQEVCDHEGVVASPIRQDVCDTNGKLSNCGETDLIATNLYTRADSSAGMPCEVTKGFIPGTGDRVAFDLDGRSAATTNKLCPPALNYSQYSPTLGQLNPQEITNRMCTALANSYENTFVHSSSTVAALPGLAVTATSSSAVKDKLHLCAKRSLEIQHIHKALLPDRDSATVSSVFPQHIDAIDGLSCQPGGEVVPPSDEERSGSGSPDWPLSDCDKITAVDRAIAVVKVEDKDTVLIKGEDLRSPFGRAIDTVETVPENRGPPDKLGKMHSFLASVSLVASQSSPVTGLRMSCRPSLSDSPAATEMQRKLPAGFPGEAGNPHHFPPQLLGVMNPASSRKASESPMGVDDACETKIESKPVVEKGRTPSFGVEAFVFPPEGASKSPVAKGPVFLQPNISAGRPICLPAASQNVASSVVVSDAFVGSIDQELGRLFARSLQGKVSVEHMPMLPQTHPNPNSLLARPAEPFREMPRNVSFGASGSSLRINPPVGGGEERVQIGARTWTPQEVFPKTTASTAEASPVATAGPGMSKIFVSSPESCCSTSLVGLSVLQTSVVPASSNAPVAVAIGKLPSKRPGHPVPIAPAPGLPSSLPLVGLVAGVRASVAEFTSGSSTSATDSDKIQPQVSRFTLTSDNRLVPSPVENRGRPRKVRVEKTQQIPIGTAQDIERSRGPAEAALVRKRASSPVSRPSVIQPSSHAISPTGSAALSPPDKKAKPDVPVWTEFRRDSTRLPDMHSPERCERPNLMSDSRQVMDPRQQQQQQLQEGFRAFGSSPVNFASSSQVAAATHLSPPPGRLASPRGSEISRQQHSVPGPLASPRLSRASPMSSPYQNIFTASSRMDDVKFGEGTESSRKDLVKLMMDMTSGSASDHARSPNQRPAMPAHHSFLPHSSASPGAHLKASLYAGESDRDKCGREQPFSHFLIPKADSDLKSPMQRVPDLLRNPARPHPEPIPVFHGGRFSAPGNNSGFPSRHDFHRSEGSLFERRMGNDDRMDTRQPPLHDNRYALHPPVGHLRERFPSIAGNSGSMVPSVPAHHSTNLVLGRADGAIIRPLNFESRQVDKR